MDYTYKCANQSLSANQTEKKRKTKKKQEKKERETYKVKSHLNQKQIKIVSGHS